MMYLQLEVLIRLRKKEQRDFIINFFIKIHQTHMIALFTAFYKSLENLKNAVVFLRK